MQYKGVLDVLVRVIGVQVLLLVVLVCIHAYT